MKRSEKCRTPTENPTHPSSGPAGGTPRPHPLVLELSGREGSRPAAAGWGALSHKVTPRGDPPRGSPGRWETLGPPRGPCAARLLQPLSAPPTINLSYTQTGLLRGKKALVHIKKKIKKKKSPVFSFRSGE